MLPLFEIIKNFDKEYYKFVLYEKLFNRKKAQNIVLSKYFNIVSEKLKQINEPTQNDFDKPFNNRIWTMWWQGEIPEVIQMCLASIKSVYPDFILITADNVKNYIDIPDYIKTKLEKGIISYPHFSDYVRVCLLEKYGGVWVDASCYMLEKIPRFITKQYFFILQSPSKKTLSNFFICAKQNNYIMKAMKIFLEEYWSKENFAVDYFFFHLFLYKLLLEHDICSKIYREMIPDNSFKYKFLSRHYRNLNFDPDQWDYLKSTSFMYKIGRKSKAAMNNPHGYIQNLLAQWRAQN